VKDEPERGFAFMTGYNGNDKCQTGEIRFTTPFLSGNFMIIVLSVNININISVMSNSIIQTVIMIIIQLLEINNIFITEIGI
jgi:hypothetical protein